MPSASQLERAKRHRSSEGHGHKKNAFITEWLAFNKVDNSGEGKRLLKRQSYPSVWIQCYRKNKKCGRDDATFAYIKLHILTCYASGIYEDKCEWKSKRQGIYELHVEHDWDPIYLDKADFYHSWRCFDSESGLRIVFIHGR